MILKTKIENYNGFGKLMFSQVKLVSINFFSMLQYRTPMLLLGLVSTQAAIGNYSAGMRFLTLLRVIPGAVFNALLPEYSKNPESTRKPLLTSALSGIRTTYYAHLRHERSCCDT
jgi:O-antigen/teichoic acid export membrane protein